MMTEYMIACQFCSQIVAVELAVGTPEGEQLEAVRWKCRCTGARKWREMQDAYAKIESIAGAGAVDNGFDYAESKATVDVLKRAADAVIDGRIRQMDMVAPGGGQIQDHHAEGRG